MYKLQMDFSKWFSCQSHLWKWDLGCYMSFIPRARLRCHWEAWLRCVGMPKLDLIKLAQTITAARRQHNKLATRVPTNSCILSSVLEVTQIRQNKARLGMLSHAAIKPLPLQCRCTLSNPTKEVFWKSRDLHPTHWTIPSQAAQLKYYRWPLQPISINTSRC